MVEKFDLQNPKTKFNFVFQLYNFVSSLANEDSHTLHNSYRQVDKLCSDVTWMNLPALTAHIRKRKRDDDDAGRESSKKPKTANAPVESDVLSESDGSDVLSESDGSDDFSEPDENEILSDVALMEELKRAGCTIRRDIKGFRTLLPVRVFSSCKGQ